jgi:GntR family transcriptional regulator
MPPSWSQTVRLAGATLRSDTISLRAVRANAAVRETLALPEGARVVRLLRRRFIDDELAAYSDTHVAADLVPGLADHLLGEESLHKVLSDAFDLAPSRAWMRAELRVCPARVADVLELRGHRMLLRTVGRVDSARHRRRLETTTTWMRPDMVRLVFEMTDGSAHTDEATQERP